MKTQNFGSAMPEFQDYYRHHFKEGFGVKNDKTQRTFFLWQKNELDSIFHTAGFGIMSFSRSLSATEKNEVWLSYVLKK